MHTNVNILKDRFPHSSEWNSPEFFYEKVEIETLDFHLLGFSATNKNRKFSVTGSAAACPPFDQELMARAYYELTERMATSDYYERQSTDLLNLDYQYSKSNGIAFHFDFDLAKESAQNEIIERDAVLRYWYAGRAPLRVYRIPREMEEVVKKLSKHYDFEFYAFISSLSHSNDKLVIASFAFPKNEKANFCYGFGCGSSLDQALVKAFSENLQTMAFLWGESFDEQIVFSSTPSYHQERYVSDWGQNRIREWFSSKSYDSKFFQDEIVPRFALEDITPAHLKDHVFVVKATEPTAIPLIFGKGYSVFDYDVDPDRFLHPIF